MSQRLAPLPRLVTRVVYHGSIAALHGRVFLASECCCTREACDTNDTYELADAADNVILRHVRRASITPA
jgi:hypothetical protein